uniref:Uncharacterized protein n=1 Tax=Meloidogyne incognita TaxID=6306 RepID=A0A914N748_MELIC
MLLVILFWTVGRLIVLQQSFYLFLLVMALQLDKIIHFLPTNYHHLLKDSTDLLAV